MERLKIQIRHIETLWFSIKKLDAISLACWYVLIHPYKVANKNFKKFFGWILSFSSLSLDIE